MQTSVVKPAPIVKRTVNQPHDEESEGPASGSRENSSIEWLYAVIKSESNFESQNHLKVDLR